MYFTLSSGLKAFIGTYRKKISLANLATFLSFIRFNEVRLEYDTGSQTLITKCRLFEDCLNSIKPALKDSIKTRFVANIEQDDPRHFSDHSSVFIYLRDILLPICGSSRRIKFEIWFSIAFESDKTSSANLISSILQISQVRNCSNVSIDLFGYNQSARLPVHDISNWLASKTVEGTEISGKKEENRFLLIYSNIIPNMKEMWEHLMEVNFFTVVSSIDHI